MSGSYEVEAEPTIRDGECVNGVQVHEGIPPNPGDNTEVLERSPDDASTDLKNAERPASPTMPIPPTHADMRDFFEGYAKDFDASLSKYEYYCSIHRQSIQSCSDPAECYAEEVRTATEHSVRRNLLAIGYIRYLESKLEKVSANEPSKENNTTSTAETDSQSKWVLDIERKRTVLDKYGDPVEELDDGEIGKNDSVAKGPILKLNRHFNKSEEHTRTSIIIRSPYILSALKAIVRSSSERQILSNKLVSIDSPYWLFFHNRKALTAYHETLPKNEEAAAHIGFFINIMREMDPVASATLDKLEAGELKQIEGSLIWLLYTPGTIVFNRVKKDWRATRIERLNSLQNMSGGTISALFMIQGWHEYRDDSNLLQPVGGLVSASWTDTDAKPIEDLEFVPKGFHPREEEIIAGIMERGRQYWLYRNKPVYQEYHGDAWGRMSTSAPFRVMVDVKQYWIVNKQQEDAERARARFRFRGNDDDNDDDKQDDKTCTCEICNRFRQHELQARTLPADSADLESDALDEPSPRQLEALLLCPSHVEAFSLTKKGWQSVRIQDLQAVTYEEEAWKKLELPKEDKRLVQSMVKAHVSNAVVIRDLIKGKGRGLVILLHGGPGTGKTLTAECVAEQQKRPLYMITCGDLGTEPTNLEEKIREAFDFANRWDAVLLLDEADVFLQERDIRQLERNALVSVFLRELEYFDGILILTTNRPGVLDEAFQSRIHLTLPLRDLDVKGQLVVWANFLAPNVGDDLKNILVWIKEETKNDKLNGRQIRNHVMTAAALASQERGGNGKIRKDHLQKVLQTARTFSLYMKALLDEDNETKARHMGWRTKS